MIFFKFSGNLSIFFAVEHHPDGPVPLLDEPQHRLPRPQVQAARPQVRPRGCRLPLGTGIS